MPAYLRRGSEDSESGFLIRTVVVIAAVLVAVTLLGELHLPRPAAYIVPASAAVILAATYLRRPAEALLSLALLVVFYDTIAFYTDGPVKQLDEIAVGLVALVGLVRAAPAWRSWLWLPRDIALAVVFAAALVSTLAQGVPVGVWVPALLLVGKSIAFLYVVTWTDFREWEIRGALRIVLIIGVVVLVLGFVELLWPGAFAAAVGLPAFTARSDLPVVKSIFVHPAQFGWFTTYIALFLFAAFLVTRRWRWLFLALAFSLGPILSARRRAILSLAAGLGAAVAESLRHRPSPREFFRAWWPVGAGVGVLLAVFMPMFVGLYVLTIDRYIPTPIESPVIGEDGEIVVDADENPQARVALYSGSVEIAMDALPLGGGLGRYASWMSRVEYSPLYEEYGLSDIRGLREENPLYVTDTFWPQILGEFGVVGLLAYLAFLGSLAWMLWRESRRPGSETMRVLRLGAGMVFGQAIVESLANAMFHSPPRVYLTYLAVGVVMSLAWRARAAEASAADEESAAQAR
jgi:hypothetical protein